MRSFVIHLAALGLLAGDAAAQAEGLEITNPVADPHAYVRVIHNAQLQPQQFTIEAWIEPTGYGYGNVLDAWGAVLIGEPSEGTAGSFLGPFFLMWRPFDGRLVAIVTHVVGSQAAYVVSTNPVHQGRAHHVAMSFDGADIRIFIDGQLDGEEPYPFASVDYGPQDLLIGAANFGPGFERRFTGVIDEVRFWDHARNATTIAALRYCRLTGNEPGLLAYWPMDAGVVADLSGNGHDGVLTGSEWQFVAEPVGLGASCGPIGSSYCGPAVPNTTGMPGVIETFGSPLVVDDHVVLFVRQLPVSEFGYFLTGQNQGYFMPPSSQGYICISGNIGRYNRVTDIIQGPTGNVAIDLTSMPVNPPTGALPGDSWNFQLWYRDMGSSNFTNAVSVTFL